MDSTPFVRNSDSTAQGDLGFSLDLISDLHFDSPKVHCKLIHFSRTQLGETAPRQVLLPIFFRKRTVSSNKKEAQSPEKSPKEQELTVLIRTHGEVLPEKDSAQELNGLTASSSSERLACCVSCGQSLSCVSTKCPKFLRTLFCCCFAGSESLECPQCKRFIS